MIFLQVWTASFKDSRNPPNYGQGSGQGRISRRRLVTACSCRISIFPASHRGTTKKLLSILPCCRFFRVGSECFSLSRPVPERPSSRFRFAGSLPIHYGIEPANIVAHGFFIWLTVTFL